MKTQHPTEFVHLDLRCTNETPLGQLKFPNNFCINSGTKVLAKLLSRSGGGAVDDDCFVFAFDVHAVFVDADEFCHAAFFHNMTGIGVSRVVPGFQTGETYLCKQIMDYRF